MCLLDLRRCNAKKFSLFAMLIVGEDGVERRTKDWNFARCSFARTQITSIILGFLKQILRLPILLCFLQFSIVCSPESVYVP